MGLCSRCGTSGPTEYGSDGQAYCNACVFYGLNKPCWRCRMYLPASELQYHKGQLACPYCIMDMRDEDRRINEPTIRKPKLTTIIYTEVCDRCGRNLEGLVYILNGRKLCKTCVDAEKTKWELVSGAPIGPGQKISLTPIIQRKKMGILSSIISETLYMLRLKKKPLIQHAIVYDAKMPIQYAKPMTEGRAVLKREEKKPQAEGLMPLDKESKKQPSKIEKITKPYKSKKKINPKKNK
ncbi:MAG: hypothetical protein ABID61_01885 [Candidatus Micrarchaeota archaeon]